jgi:hypothetical protein
MTFRQFKNKSTIAAVLLLTASALAAPGVSFLEIPVGGRESALGGAGAALVTGPTSAVYNPATVAWTRRSVALMHNRHFGDTNAEFIGFTLRRNRWAISPSFRGTRVPDIEYRIEPTSEPISQFDATNEAVGTAIAWEVNQYLAVGVAGKYLHQKILYESSEGWSMDAGVLARCAEKGLTAGVSLNHFGDMNYFIAEKPTLPTTLRGGIAYERDLAKVGTILVTADALSIRDSSPQYRGGIEFRAPNYVALRVGGVAGLDAEDVSMGFGLFVKHIQFDYAFIPYREDLGEGHRFSLTLEL